MKQKSLEKRLAADRRREVRKVKSREAARCRRGKEFEVFADLTDSLPIPESNKLTFDKASIIRLSINYMKCRDFFRNICEITTPIPCAMDSFLQDLVEGMQSFIMILSPTSEIIYVTENIKLLLGLCQYDVIGSRLFEFTHPCDVKEAEDQARSNKDTCSFIARFKTTLLPKGRVVNVKSATYKAVKFTGQRLVADINSGHTKKEVMESAQPLPECLVVTGMPLSQPCSSEQPMDSMTFTSKHSLDMKFVDCDTQMTDLLKYPGETLLGASLYDVVHGSDIKQVEEDFKTLYSKGQTVTEPYRQLAYGGGFVQVVTKASMVYNQKTSRPQHIVCVNYLLSSVQHPDLVMARIQMPEEAGFDSSVTVKEQNAGRPYCMLLDDLSDKSAKDIISLTASMFDQGCDANGFTEDDVFNTTAKAFCSEVDPESIHNDTAAVFSTVQSDTIDVTAGMFSDEPSVVRPKPDLDRLVEKLDGDLDELHSGLIVDTSGLNEEFDQEFFLRAPYIPMDTQDDVNLLESCCPFTNQSQDELNNYGSMMDLKPQPIHPSSSAASPDYVRGETLYSPSTNSTITSPEYPPSTIASPNYPPSYRDSGQHQTSSPDNQNRFSTEYPILQHPNQILLQRHVKGISPPTFGTAAPVFGAMTLEPDKLSNLMADMFTITNRIPGPLGMDGTSRQPLDSSPTQTQNLNSAKRKRHSATDPNDVGLSLPGTINLDGPKLAKQSKSGNALRESGQVSFRQLKSDPASGSSMLSSGSNLLTSRSMADENFVAFGGVRRGEGMGHQSHLSYSRKATQGTGSVSPNINYSHSTTGDPASESYRQLLNQLMPKNYNPLLSLMSIGGGTGPANLRTYSPLPAATAKTRERAQDFTLSPTHTDMTATMAAGCNGGELLLPLLMD